MPVLAVFLFACATSYALAVDLHVYPTDEEMPPRMTPDEVDHANSMLTALGLTSWFACPLAKGVTNKMVTLADGYTYDQDSVVASSRNTSTLKSPHYQHLTIPTSLAFAFVNLDLMDIAKNAESIEQSVSKGEIPETIRPWIGPPLRQPIWICADGRSRLTTSFKSPFALEQLGMLLVFDNGDFCFRNIRLEQVVDEICRRVGCGTGDLPPIREAPARMDTAHVEPDAHQSLSTSSQLSPSTASSRPSLASQHQLTIDTSSSETSTAVPSPTSTASSISGSSPLANRQQPRAPLVSPVGADDAGSIDWADFADSIPWPSDSEVRPAPSLPFEMSSAWAATIAYTRALVKGSYWDRANLSPLSSPSIHFYAALFWAYHYRTTFKPDDMELPPKPTNPGDLRGWQASCHRFFQAAEDVAVNAISKKRARKRKASGRPFGPVNRRASRLQQLVRNLGLVLETPSFGSKRKRIMPSDDSADTIPWPNMSAVTPVPSLPRVMSSAAAATVAHTRSLDDRNRWDWQALNRTNVRTINDALFWVHQYTTKWEPPGMSLPPKPASSDGFREWQASCYRFFKAAEDRIAKAILKKQGVADDVDEGSAGISRISGYLRRHVAKLGLPIDYEHKPRKRAKRS